MKNIRESLAHDPRYMSSSAVTKSGTVTKEVGRPAPVVHLPLSAILPRPSTHQSTESIAQQGGEDAAAAAADSSCSKSSGNSSTGSLDEEGKGSSYKLSASSSVTSKLSLSDVSVDDAYHPLNDDKFIVHKSTVAATL